MLARIDAASRAASESGLDALGGFGRAADEAVRGAVAAERPLAALSASVREFGEAADRIVVFVRDGWPLVDRWALEEHSETIAALRAGERAADAAFFKALIAEAGDERFRVLAPETNPTHGWDVAERAARMAAGLDDLRRSPDTDEGLTGRIAELSGRASEAAERARAASEMRWNWFTRAEVRGLAAEVSSLVGALESEYEGARAEVAERAEAWVREVRAQRARFGAGPLDAEWAARRDELLSGAERDGDYVGMRRRFAAMEGVLERVGEVIGGSGSLTTPPRLVRYDPQALLGAVRARSGHAAEPAIRAARWDGDGYANADEMVEIARAHTAAAQEWYDTLREMILAMDAVQGRLDDFYLLDRAPAGAASASSLLDTWVGHPVFDEVNGSEVFRDLLEYAERVRALGRETDRMVLASVATESDEPAHAYAAWARLGELRDPDWPRTPGELAREAEAAGRIVGAVSAVGDAGWRAALEREIAEAGRVRWTRCAEAARTEADLLACFDRREGFGVEESDLSPRLRYNLALLRLREAAQPEADESFVESAAGAFVEEVSGLPAGYAGRADALGVAGRVSRTVEEWRSGPGRVDFSRLGPGVLGWGAEPNDDDTMVAFEWRGERRARNAPAVPRLEFVRVDLSDEAVFISRDEVSLALMRGWLRSEQWEELIPVLSLEQDNASWTGPRGWLWPGQPRNGLILNSGRPRERDMWLAQNVEVTANSPQYAPGIGDPADHVRIASQFRPTEAHPVQHVSPVGASKFAETLGCRLPSAEEWLGALRRHEDVGGAVWNLRDETFALQRDHAREMIERRLAAGAVRANFRYPDEGAFVPDGVRVDRGAEARVYPGNDGSLWFQRADQGPGRMLRHMIGNVAEFVTVVGSDGSVRYAVIGGSAMSAPELELDRPYPIPARLNSETYADVGFRLAFGAGEIRVRLGRQLADAISGVGFDLSGRGG